MHSMIYVSEMKMMPEIYTRILNVLTTTMLVVISFSRWVFDFLDIKLS